MARKRKPEPEPNTGQRTIGPAPASKPPMTSLPPTAAQSRCVPPPLVVPVRRASRARRPGH